MGEAMKIIGLTGGIGAGKTTVALILKKLGAYIIDADKIAKEIVKKGQKTFEKLVNFFGPQILNNNGELDRKKLADLVFDDPKKLTVLNEITHREVYKKMREEIKILRDKGYQGIVILDVPIPNEEFRKMVDEIWVVDTDIENRIERVIKKRGFTEEELRKRMDAQLKREEYLKIADRVIKNNGSIEELEDIVYKLYKDSLGD